MPATHFDIESYRVFPCIACHMITSSISFECHMIIDSSSHAALAKVKYTPHGTASVQLRSLYVMRRVTRLISQKQPHPRH